MHLSLSLMGSKNEQLILRSIRPSHVVRRPYVVQLNDIQAGVRVELCLCLSFQISFSSNSHCKVSAVRFALLRLH